MMTIQKLNEISLSRYDELSYSFENLTGLQQTFPTFDEDYKLLTGCHPALGYNSFINFVLDKPNVVEFLKYGLDNDQTSFETMKTREY